MYLIKKEYMYRYYNLLYLFLRLTCEPEYSNCDIPRSCSRTIWYFFCDYISSEPWNYSKGKGSNSGQLILYVIWVLDVTRYAS